MEHPVGRYLRDAQCQAGLECWPSANFGSRRGLQRAGGQGRHLRRGADRSRRPAYCAMDVHLTWRLTPLLRGQLQQAGGKACRSGSISWELPLEPVLARIGGHRHFASTSPILRPWSEDWPALSPASRPVPAKPLVWSSTWPHPNNWRAAVRHPGGWSAKNRARQKRAWSTTQAVLAKSRPITRVVAAGCWSTAPLSKLKSTLMWIAAAALAGARKPGLVHTGLHQAVTATDGSPGKPIPNLQKHPHSRTQFRPPHPPRPSCQEGWQLISADYSRRAAAILTKPLRRKRCAGGLRQRRRRACPSPPACYSDKTEGQQRAAAWANNQTLA